jgi:hypothetical protein
LQIPARPQLGWWAALAIGLVTATVFASDLARLRNPIGEKYMAPEQPGQIDFSCAYLGARALLAGVNPYRNDRPEFTSPIFGITKVQGVEYKQIYPPGQLMLYVPLALWKGEAWEQAARIWFDANLLFLLSLGFLTWYLVRCCIDEPLSATWIPIFTIILALSAGVELGLERGQSDLFTALLCWGALVLLLRGHAGTPLFLSIWAASLKGYPALFTVGLGLLALRRWTWKRALAGAGLAVLVLIVPGLRYMGDAARGARMRSEMFWPHWYNHGFRNAVYQFSHEGANAGRYVLSALALVVTLAAWVQARRALRRGTPAEKTLWLSVFGSASLGTMLGYSSLSVAYNLVLVLPGVLVLLASQARLTAMLDLPRWAVHALGAALTLTAFLLFVHRLGATEPKGGVTGFPASAFGLIALFLILGALVGRALTIRPRSA